MWRESLITQLVRQLVGKKSRRPDWRSPTWSWISIDGAISYWGCWNQKFWRLIEYAQVLEAWARPSGPDPYGAVTDGELTVSCTLLVRDYMITDGNVGEQSDDLVRVEGGFGIFPVMIDYLRASIGSK
ncbi:hypothetical protein J7T55_003016 [Diaporthe amygdali]|uniref:uncharacterized protein n=1 Tax=Phomopsis amygdali TaxID=1214568 RepID=UPI0022FE7334|nr:uncharacterized protein J7T55_003016 [Diaporthe amygdali]KAJ0122503.1 hypothetical protein J7T55_003016 [Diaporthe amygdali]